MAEINKKQIEILRGNFPKIAAKHGCTREYVSKVMNGKVESDTELTRGIKETASRLLLVMEPTECIEA